VTRTLLLLLGCAAACGGSAAEADARLAEQHFEGRCAACHGMDGKGRGPVSASLNPQPRDWTDRSWQASVTDAEIQAVIRDGGAAHGLSPAMPASEHAGRAAVVEALVAKVRGFGR
jgi:cytochrome c553